MKRFFALLVLVGLAVGSVAAWQLGYLERARNRLYGRPVRLSAGDFPAGVSAPVDDVAAVPMRTTLIGYVPRGGAASLVLADQGLFKSAVAIDARSVPFQSSFELQRALTRGAENGGVDFAILTVNELALSAQRLRDCAPRTVMLVSRSRGQDVLGVGPSLHAVAELKGKRLATERAGPSHYLALWALSRAGLSVNDVSFVALAGPFEAGEALSQGRADAVAGVVGDVTPAAAHLGGSALVSTVDAPHLIASVLVVRGDFAARYPDGVRRVVRGLLDAAAAVVKEPEPAARALGEVQAKLGDPLEAIRSAPPATTRENLAFFGVSGESPVTYRELFQSAAALGSKLYQNPAAPDPDDTVDLSALKFVASTRKPDAP